MLKTFHIIKHSRATEKESSLEILIVELSEVKYWGHSNEYTFFNPQGTPFIFLLESRAAKKILNQVITDPLQLNMDEFEMGDLNAGNGFEEDVHMHKDYVKKRRLKNIQRVDKEVRQIDYEDFGIAIDFWRFFQADILLFSSKSSF